jgi:hypothetical protein
MASELKKAEQLDHVRRPDLPWRVSITTECGRPVDDVKSHISRDELLARYRDFGQARTSLTTCMTCWQTSRRWQTFETDPVDALRREVYGGRTEKLFGDELRALAALALAHRDEFDAYLAGLGETANLAERRGARRRRA